MSGSHSIKIGGLTLPRGNSKLGRVLNISLPPPKTCGASMPCFKGGCYAMRHCYSLNKTVRTAWDGNWAVWASGDAHGYAASIKAAVEKAKPAMFRWHVGGDIPDRYPGEGDSYVGVICNVADAFPQTRFVLFTKKIGVVRRNAALLRSAPNLMVILSMWPGLPCHYATVRAWPTAWMQDPKNTDGRIPKDVKECSGRCDECMMCASLKPGESVAFDRH